MNLATVLQGNGTTGRTAEELRNLSPPLGVAGIAEPSIAIPKGHPVTRSPEQLHLHPAFKAVGWSDVIREFNNVDISDQSALEPILITSDGTILAGFAQWKLAATEGRRELHCKEYAISPDEALRLLLAYHQPRAGWNPFIRICLALTLESYFQERALANMREGGKFKGLANLPEASRIDVRQEIARLAGVGARGRNIGNVKKILQLAHPRLISALQDGALTINRALQFCKLSGSQQLAAFIRYSEDRATMKVVREYLHRCKNENHLPKAVSALELLQRMEAVQPGPVMIRAARLQRTVVLIGQDLLSSTHSQGELKLNEVQDPLRQILTLKQSYWDNKKTRPAVRVAFRKAMQCRTSALGAEVYSSGNEERSVFHTCKGSACSSCGYRATVQWQRERWAALPDVPYKGITFTMPDVLWPLFRENPHLARALPALAANVFQARVNAEHGLRVGVIDVLHSFNGQLDYNSHVTFDTTQIVLT